MRATLLPVALHFALVLIATAADPAPSPALSAADRSRAVGMLRLARDATVREFYDPARVDDAFLARCKAAEEKLATATNNDEAMMIIAQPFFDIGDSHTFFVPPRRRHRVDHDWRARAVGDLVFINHVNPGSDAADKGLRRGDQLISVDGIAASRQHLWLLGYLTRTLAPRSGMRLVVRAPGAEPRQLDVAGRVTERPGTIELYNEKSLLDEILHSEEVDARYASQIKELPGGILVWRLRRFSEDTVEPGLRKIDRARAVILDLRSNAGGSVTSANKAIAGFFRDDFDLSIERTRKRTETERIQGRGLFQGPLFVLINSESYSAAEIFARVVQQRQRGVLIGDRTGGALSTGKAVPLSLGTADQFVAFAMMVTIKSVTMADGTVIEGRGVAPDLRLLPTHEDLWAGRDPALARAVSMAGGNLSLEDAGTLFPTTIAD